MAYVTDGYLKYTIIDEFNHTTDVFNWELPKEGTQDPPVNIYFILGQNESLGVPPNTLTLNAFSSDESHTTIGYITGKRTEDFTDTTGTTHHSEVDLPLDLPTNFYMTTPYNTNIPIFAPDDEEGLQKYIDTGDDSSALNFGELHPPRYNFYLNNDGRKITLQWKEKDDSETEITRIKVTITDEHDELVETTEITSGSMHRWSVQSIKPNPINLNSLKANFTIQGYVYPSDTPLFTLVGYVQTKFIMVVGKNLCYAIKGEDNGSNLYCTVGDEQTIDGDEIDEGVPDAELPDLDTGGFTSLLHTYQVTNSNLALLGNFIWRNSIFDTLKNINNSPIENIVSCKYMPCSISEGGGTYIKIGNVNTEIDGFRLDKNTTVRHIMSAQTTANYIPNSSYLDYEPFTSYTLYLPFVGLVPLNTKDCAGGYILIDYTFDVVCGTYGVLVYSTRGGGKTLIYSTTGSCGIDIPLTASNRSQIESSIIQTGITGVEAVATGGISLVGAVNSGSDIINLQNHSTTCGCPSSMLSSLVPSQCYIIKKTPIEMTPANYKHTVGYMAQTTAIIKNTTGFTICKNVDTSGITCTDSERGMIKSLLESGIYA